MQPMTLAVLSHHMREALMVKPRSQFMFHTALAIEGSHSFCRSCRLGTKMPVLSPTVLYALPMMAFCPGKIPAIQPALHNTVYSQLTVVSVHAKPCQRLQHAFSRRVLVMPLSVCSRVKLVLCHMVLADLPMHVLIANHAIQVPIRANTVN